MTATSTQVEVKPKRKRKDGDFTKRERDVRLALFEVLAKRDIDADTQWKIADDLIDALRKQAMWL